MNTGSQNITRRSYLTLPLILLLLLFPLACSKSEGAKDLSAIKSTTSSGDSALDQTAYYALFTIQKVKRRSNMNTPRDILEYMFSIQGSAELTPPSLELEPDMAETFSGPRPANGVGLYGRRMKVLPKEIIIEANEDSFTATAFDNETDEKLHSWSWSF